MVNRHVITNPAVSINGVDLSAHVAKVKVMYSREEIDATAGNASGAKGRAAGLVDHLFDVEFVQDFDAALVDATLEPLALAGASFPVIVSPKQGAAAQDNPTYTGDCLLFDYSPFDVGIGELARTSVSLPGDGGFSVARL